MHISRDFDLIGMANDWREENPEGTLNEFLDWATQWAFDKFNESFDPWDEASDIMTRSIEIHRGFSMSGTEWELMKQVKGQLDIFGGEVE